VITATGSEAAADGAGVATAPVAGGAEGVDVDAGAEGEHAAAQTSSAAAKA
jgi:hypothetical protein